MEYIGIDLHKKESQICLLTETRADFGRCRSSRGTLHSGHPKTPLALDECDRTHRGDAYGLGRRESVTRLTRSAVKG
jgi:hypothetical protein